MKGNGAKKAPILRWKGVLAESNFTLRVLVALVIATGSAALSFTQLGFAGIGSEGEYAAYAVVLLVPVALGALLFGTLFGTLFGLFTGSVLYLHATLLPLDYYELEFVTPVTSIGLMTVSGFLLGLFFAIALRKDPRRIKRAIYLVIVCFLVSWFYSSGFWLNVFTDLVSDISTIDFSGYSETETQDYISAQAITTAMRIGDIGLQMFVDAVLMALPCIIADVVVRRVKRIEGTVGVRSVFAAWLTAVVAMAFFITAGVSFVSITLFERNSAETGVRSEVEYLHNQLVASSDHVKALDKLLTAIGVDYESLPADSFNDLVDVVSDKDLLKGYEKNINGTIVIASALRAGDEPFDAGSAAVTLTDDNDIAVGKTFADVFNDETIDAIERSLETDEMQRFIYDKVHAGSLVDSSEWAEQYIQTELAYAYAQQVDDELIVMIMPSNEVYRERGAVMAGMTLSFFAVLLVVSVLTTVLLSLIVVRRIDETNGVLSRVTQGNLDARVNVRDTREFESLSDGINETVDALKGWISEAETRMDAELATAKAIQESALPQIFPPYPDIQQFDIYAIMHAAKEVGGDFYDFFLINNDDNPDASKLAFVVADVSGKGVPAALFMMKAKTQIRDYLLSGMNLDEAVENANRQLVDGNDAGMFVTAWVGVLDYATGHVEYVNAGHNPPLFWCKDGGWRWLTEKSGIPLGLFDGFPYSAFTVDCSIGDTFLLYSDGVTEAMDTEGRLYGEERFKALLDENYTLHPRALVEVVRTDVAAHAQGAVQSDDITVLALEFGVPPEMTATLSVPADVKELPRVNEFVHAELDRRLCPVRVQNQLDIAVEELFVNVAHYAYPDATPQQPGTVRVSCTYSADPPSVTVDIADEGIPYNPLAKPDAVTPEDIMEVPIGGLGILMAKNSVDEMRYERIDSYNVVTIVKKW